jgi:hypothetical protein
MGRCPIKPKASPFELRECRHRGARNLLEAHHHTTAAGNKPSLRARSSAAVISSARAGRRSTIRLAVPIRIGVAAAVRAGPARLPCRDKAAYVGLGFIWGIPAQAAPTRRFRCAGGHSAEKGRTPQEPEFNLAKRRLCNTVGRIVRGSNACCAISAARSRAAATTNAAR